MAASTEAPPSSAVAQLQQALAKTEAYMKLAASAQKAEDRAYYERMYRKWLGIADGWRMIANIDKTQR